MGSTVILGYARTPFGRFLGSLHEVAAVELGAVAIREALNRAGVTGEEVDNVLLGMVVQAGAGQIPSRQATVKAGLPYSVPSETINKVCASGLRAVNLADMMIRTGEADLIVGGGMENMSSVPYYMPKVRTGCRMGDCGLIDGMVHDGLWCPFHNVHMGVHGSAVPAEHGITRQEMDRFALRSHQLAVEAIDKGLFEDEITPVQVPQRKGEPVIFKIDELPRRDTSLEMLAKLPPAFEKEGLITAGNAPAISDGAAALVVSSEEKARELGRDPLAEIIAQASVSLEPKYIATVPYEAAKKAMAKAGLKAEDMKLIEVNEAFAAVALTCIKLGGWNEDQVNVNGGAVAIGHPIGASGARILITLISELRRRGGGYGLATICSGAAQGEAIIVKV
ncbi:MAG: acetyl-CoA C-acetyltransferase [Dethiobacteria bacterium]|nr:acetyl-CoA C-acetyltransferase [Bacillota bacterium]MDW7729119.1 acetyl-CoA C-acetyltransferase [Bacillota bacterium]